MGEPVLPPMKPSKRLYSIDDMLTPEGRRELYDDLAEMARLRRRAAATARDVVLW